MGASSQSSLFLWSATHYSLLTAVITSKYSDKVPNIMAYLKIITRASRNYEDLAWASYNAVFRLQAANRNTFNWSTTLFNAFTGRARFLPRCPYCLSDIHREDECQYDPHEDFPQSKIPRKSSNPVGGCQIPADKGQTAAVQIYDKFNQATGNQCSFHWCCYASEGGCKGHVPPCPVHPKNHKLLFLWNGKERDSSMPCFCLAYDPCQ